MSEGASRASRRSRRRLASTIGGGPATYARTSVNRPFIFSPATACTKARSKGLHLVEEEAVPRGADAEVHVPVPVAEVSARARVGEDRHHARDAASSRDAEHVLAQGGVKGGVAQGSEEAEPGALDALAEEPLADRAAGLLLDHEGQALGEAIVVDHGIGAGPHDSRHGEERELD